MSMQIKKLNLFGKLVLSQILVYDLAFKDFTSFVLRSIVDSPFKRTLVLDLSVFQNNHLARQARNLVFSKIQTHENRTTFASLLYQKSRQIHSKNKHLFEQGKLRTSLIKRI